MMKKAVALCLALILLFAVSACGGTSQEQPATSGPAAPESTSAISSETEESPAEEAEPKEPIKIGHIVDLTGVEAFTGEEYKRAVEFAIEQLGGEIAGHPVEIIVGDAQNQPSGAVDLAKKMVEEDGVVAILGPTQIGQKAAVAGYVDSLGVPLIFYNPTPTGLIQNNKWVVGANGGTAQMPSVMADYAYNELGYRTVHTISMDNTGGRSFIDPFVETFTALGGTIDTQLWTPMPCPDYAPYLASLGEADALVAWDSGSDAIALWKNWYELGLNETLPIITTMHGGFTDYFVAETVAAANPAAADAMIGTYACMMYAKDIDTPESRVMLDAWIEKYGEEPRFVAAGSCSQAVLLLKEAMEATGGDTDPEKLIDAMLNADFVGPEGHEKFEGSNTATKDIYVMRVVKLEDGRFDHEFVKVYEDVPPSGLSY